MQRLDNMQVSQAASNGNQLSPPHLLPLLRGEALLGLLVGVGSGSRGLLGGIILVVTATAAARIISAAAALREQQYGASCSHLALSFSTTIAAVAAIAFLSIPAAHMSARSFGKDGLRP